MIRILRDSVSRRCRFHANCLSQRNTARAARLLANILEAARGLIPSRAAMNTSPIASRVDLARAETIPAGEGSPARL